MSSHARASVGHRLNTTARVTGARAGGRAADQPPQDTLRGVVHDLRQPVASIRALVASCRATLDDGRRPDEALRRIDDQVQHLLELVASVLDDGSPSGGGASPASVAASIEEAVAYVRTVHRVDARVVRTMGGGVRAGTSEVTLRRALMNVLDNAARAAGTEGSVVVSTRRLQGEIHVRVDDSGPGFGGLAAEHQVGLRSAAHQLSREGGRIDVSSSRRLGGASVTIVVPAARPLGASNAGRGSRRATSRL
jgi:signal transduction histidine kinase